MADQRYDRARTGPKRPWRMGWKGAVTILLLAAIGVAYPLIRYEYVSHSLLGTHFQVRKDRLSGDSCLLGGSAKIAKAMRLPEC